MFFVDYDTKMNFHMLSGSNPLVLFAKASILMKCAIQTMCVKTNIRVSFTPPDVTYEDCLKMLYYHHQDFTVCQRVMEIRLNEGNEDSSKQMEPDFSEFEKEPWIFFKNYLVVYGYDSFHSIYEVEIYASFSVLQKFETFFEKIPHDSSVVFINNCTSSIFYIFVKTLLRRLGRKKPIDACSESGWTAKRNIVQTWLSKNEPRRDLIAHLSTLRNMKVEFIISLSPFLLSVARNASSKYSNIHLPTPSKNELEAMTFLSSGKYQNSNIQISHHRKNMEKYLRRTDF